MAMISKTAAVGIGLIGVIVGYCVYFDQKRRNDPDFKKKLRERRKAKKDAQKSRSRLPDMKDHENVQKYFLQQVELGEELLAMGDTEGGIEHLANAIAVCGQPQQLLQVLQKTLPPQIFNLLLQRLPVAGQKIHSQAVAMAEEDVE